MNFFLKMMLSVSLFLPLVGHAQDNQGGEDRDALTKNIDLQLRRLEGLRDSRRESYAPARIAPQVYVVKYLLQKRKDLHGEDPSLSECDRLGIDYCYKISPYLQELNRKLSTREGIEMEMKRLRSQLEIYKNDQYRLGIIHGDLAALYIRLSGK